MFAKIYLEITNACNLNCSFCAGTSRKKHRLSMEEFSFLAKAVRPYTDFLYFHVMGEPLSHPLLGDFLEEANRLGFRVILTTNGVLLPALAPVLLSAPALFKVSISLHAFEANTGIDLEDYLNGCFDFGDKASQQGIISVFRLWNDGGLNTFNGAILESLHKRFEGEWVPNTKGIRIRKKLFIENGEKFDWPGYGAYSEEAITCYGLKDHIGVLCDGTVVPCCLDYDGNMALGNLFQEPLQDILEREETKKFRADLDACKAPHDFCKTCGYARQKFHR